MELNRRFEMEEYDPMQDPIYLDEINAILMFFKIQDRIKRDFNCLGHPDLPKLRTFQRVAARRRQQRPRIKGVGVAAPRLRSCPVM